MEYKQRDTFAAELGNRLLDDAEKLLLFMPECYCEARITWAKRKFKITIEMEKETEQ
jgi:hypothetical protein